MSRQTILYNCRRSYKHSRITVGHFHLINRTIKKALIEKNISTCEPAWFDILGNVISSMCLKYFYPVFVNSQVLARQLWKPRPARFLFFVFLICICYCYPHHYYYFFVFLNRHLSFPEPTDRFPSRPINSFLDPTPSWIAWCRASTFAVVRLLFSSLHTAVCLVIRNLDGFVFDTVDEWWATGSHR